jgi:signal peptidase II
MRDAVRPALPDGGAESESTHVQSSPAKRYSMFLALAIAVLAIDQILKAIVTANLKGGSVVEILGGAIRFDYTSNTGGAFSIFRGGGVLFASIAVLVCIGLIVPYRRIAGSPVVVRVALGLILGGALGNLLDRMRLGYVVDFVDLRWWPVFNVADSAVVVGVALLILHAWFEGWTRDRSDRLQGERAGRR